MNIYEYMYSSIKTNIGCVLAKQNISKVSYIYHGPVCEICDKR